MVILLFQLGQSNREDRLFPHFHQLAPIFGAIQVNIAPLLILILILFAALIGRLPVHIRSLSA